MFPFSTTLTAGDYTLGASDKNILVDTTDGVVNLVLPSIASIVEFSAKQGYSVGMLTSAPYNIVDIANNASVNNITITTNPADGFCGGLASVVINQNGGSALIMPVSNTLWNVNLSGVGGANSAIASSKSLVMKINQAGGKKPDIISIGQNDFGVAPSFQYIGVGQYRLIVTGAFPDETKVFFFQKQIGKAIDAGGGKLAASFVQLTAIDINTIGITTFEDGKVPADTLLSLHDIHIMVYS